MANELEIFAKRLKSARLMSKLSMEGLSNLMNGQVSKQTISKYEAAKMLPSSTILLALSQVLNVDPDYFFRPYNFDMESIEVSFRKKRSVSAKEESALKEHVQNEVERYLEVEDILGIQQPFTQTVNKAPISSHQDMVIRAQELRRDWHLGDAPIANVQSLLENKDIRVIALDNAPTEFDGLSGIINGKYPVIVLNAKKTVERKRLTALHELGHILFNEYFASNLSEHDKEKLCTAFASEMLIGTSIVASVFGANRKEISLNELLPLQQDFGVSIDAIVAKAFQIGLMSESRYRGYFIRKNQSPSFKDFAEKNRYDEKPTQRFESLVYCAMARELITESKASSLLGIPVSEVRNGLNLM